MSNTLGDYGTPPDPLNVRVPDPRDARIAELEARNRKLEKVLRPFAGAVYNDNGDISVSASSVSFDAWADAYFAMKDCAALSTKEDVKG